MSNQGSKVSSLGICSRCRYAGGNTSVIAVAAARLDTGPGPTGVERPAASLPRVGVLTVCFVSLTARVHRGGLVAAGVGGGARGPGLGICCTSPSAWVQLPAARVAAMSSRPTSAYAASGQPGQGIVTLRRACVGCYA